MFQVHKPGNSVFLFACIFLLLSTAQVLAEIPEYKMVRIRAGSFLMGSPEGVVLRREDEQLHKVTLTRDFFMGRYEVTQDFYETIMGSNPSYNNVCPDCPVERITWNDAIVFCNAVSLKAGLDPAYDLKEDAITLDLDASGYRLPTEAEWEYACRAGTRTIFPYGDCLSASQANYNAYWPQPGCKMGVYRAQSIPVGTFQPNGWGLYDMIGNINEFCWDTYAPFSAEPLVDPTGTEVPGQQVLRGGGFSIFGPRCQSGSRHPMNPDMAMDFMGLRMVRTAVALKGAKHE